VESAALHGLHRIGSVKFACTTSITAVVRSNVEGDEGCKRVIAIRQRLAGARLASGWRVAQDRIKEND
jgi:hypothetical protein